MAVYSQSLDAGIGRLFFMREGSLLAQAFDERSLKPQGDPIAVAERVGSAFLSGNFSVSPSGVLAYRAGEALPWLSRLSWFDRQGKQLGKWEGLEHIHMPISHCRLMERTWPQRGSTRSWQAVK